MLFPLSRTSQRWRKLGPPNSGALLGRGPTILRHIQRLTEAVGDLDGAPRHTSHTQSQPSLTLTAPSDPQLRKRVFEKHRLHALSCKYGSRTFKPDQWCVMPSGGMSTAKDPVAETLVSPLPLPRLCQSISSGSPRVPRCVPIVGRYGARRGVTLFDEERRPALRSPLLLCS